jgi:hypothetical protein
MEIKINLIPPYRKEEITKSKRLKLVMRIGMAIFSIAVLFFSFLFGVYKILEINYLVVSDFQKSSADKDKYERIKQLDGEFQKINIQMADLISIKEDQFYWSNMFIRLSHLVIPGVSLDNVATKDYAVFLVGKANNRDNLILFKEKLEREECFSDINLPLSNLVSKEDIDFQIDFKIKSDCLKQR